MEDQTPVAAEPSAATNVIFELGKWLGQHLAFGWIASKCSAADAHILRKIRDEKQYRALNLNWETFCTVHTGMSARSADRLIDRLEEFGESYFNLSQLLRITPDEYRALEPAVAQNVLEYKGRRIPITRENTQELAEAVDAARHELAKLKDAAGDYLFSVRMRLHACFSELAHHANRRLDEDQRERLIGLIQSISAQVQHLGKFEEANRQSLR